MKDFRVLLFTLFLFSFTYALDLCTVNIQDYTLAFVIASFSIILYYVIMLFYARITGDRNIEITNTVYVRETIVLGLVIFAFTLLLEVFTNASLPFLEELSSYIIQTPSYIDHSQCIRQNSYNYLKAVFMYSSAVIDRLEMSYTFTTFFSTMRFSSFCISEARCMGGGGVFGGFSSQFGVDEFRKIIGNLLMTAQDSSIYLGSQLVMLLMFSSELFYRIVIVAFILRFFPFTKTLGNIMLATFLSFYFIYPFVLYMEAYAFRLEVDRDAVDNIDKMKEEVSNRMFEGSDFIDKLRDLEPNQIRRKYKDFANILSSSGTAFISDYWDNQNGFCLASIEDKAIGGDKDRIIFCMRSLQDVVYDLFLYSVFTLSLNLVIMIVAIKTLSALMGNADTMIDLFMKVI